MSSGAAWAVASSSHVHIPIEGLRNRPGAALLPLMAHIPITGTPIASPHACMRPHLRTKALEIASSFFSRAMDSLDITASRYPRSCR
eukprot:COSAG04_NODE_6783_length_1257_cov_1.328152_1_plen_87_part_00